MTRTRTPLALFGAALLLVASSAPALTADESEAPIPTDRIKGLTWQLSAQLTHGSLAPVPADVVVTLRLKRDEATGNACDIGAAWYASYVLGGDALSFSDVSFDVSDPGPPTPVPPSFCYEVEGVYFANLANVATWFSDGANLTLSDADGNAILFFGKRKAMTRRRGWVASGINDGSGGVVSSDITGQVTAVFGREGELTGWDGCNDYSTTYAIDPDAIVVSAAIATTRKACASDELSAQSAQYVAALTAASTWSVDPSGTLELRDASGALQVSFTPAAGSLAEASEPPVAVQTVDWVTIEDASLFGFGDNRVSDVAVAPGGGAVMVGVDLDRGRHLLQRRPTDGRVWSSPDGRDWQSAVLPRAQNAYPRRVMATNDGFIAIGERRFPNKPDKVVGLIWTSRDGTDWSAVAFDRARLAALDSAGDTVVVAGTLRGTPTVWTSKAGRPWEAGTIAERSTGFTPHQLAVSADGIYLVRDARTGQLYRSDDGMRFTTAGLLAAPPADPPEGLAGRGIDALARVAGGFVLVVQDGLFQDGDWDLISSTWFSPDGLEWRRGDTLPGLALKPVSVHRGAALMVADRAAYDALATPYLAYLQADGTWCAVSDPSRGSDYLETAAWSEDGRLVATAGGPGTQIIWQATAIQCDR